ncbi:UNVERIFIED_CONTAM: hypothetical protein Slati_2400500 [Sesamum latifolium]|uniref:Uncharacterized protein n=1 Tax=Sesamum latifolium TaxID=2727402 RepID=A0AAW2WD30_9LAMI
MSFSPTSVGGFLSPLAMISNWSEGVEEWVRHVREGLEHDHFNMFIMLNWSLWERRNKLVMENADCQPDECVAYAEKLVLGFSNVVTTKHPCNPSPSRWTIPKQDEIKINFDVLVSNKKNGVGVGVIAQDHR